ncbi:unnamed protein product [Nippostrongylus brasiliensis]|uniref:Uncharacterized protein n=1 Tax=Nippostrongylus brasiliensis TaxID=27835 RepID=A0A0N4XKN7_NIPBR|nr:unnamed protein product [Nippostrongylus brasiliensis]
MQPQQSPSAHRESLPKQENDAQETNADGEEEEEEEEEEGEEEEVTQPPQTFNPLRYRPPNPQRSSTGNRQA